MNSTKLSEHCLRAIFVHLCIWTSITVGHLMVHCWPRPWPLLATLQLTGRFQDWYTISPTHLQMCPRSPIGEDCLLCPPPPPSNPPNTREVDISKAMELQAWANHLPGQPVKSKKKLWFFWFFARFCSFLGVFLCFLVFFRVFHVIGTDVHCCQSPHVKFFSIICKFFCTFCL